MDWMTLNPGDLVIDYATPKDLRKIKAAGYKAIARYLPTSEWKGLTVHEMNEILAYGFGLFAIFETSKDRAFKGAVHGTYDGRRARDMADRIGFKGTIIWTLDTDAITELQAINAVAYGRAFQEAVGRQCGAYCDGEVIAMMSSPDEFIPIWTPNARWWSRLWPGYRHPNTHILQQLHNIPGTDHGVVLRPVDVWIGDFNNETADPTPPSKVIPTPPLYKTKLSPFVKNDKVVELQQVLTMLGYYKHKIDGKFGNKTEDAVKLWQVDLGVKSDGLYGPKTATAYRNSIS